MKRLLRLTLAVIIASASAAQAVSLNAETCWAKDDPLKCGTCCNQQGNAGAAECAAAGSDMCMYYNNLWMNDCWSGCDDRWEQVTCSGSGC